MSFKDTDAFDQFRLSTFALIGILAAVPVSDANATDRTSQARFIGFWEAVDPGDGSATQRSVTCDTDGTCEILGSDTFWTVCGSDRGILRGDGVLGQGRLSIRNFTLTCADGPEVSADTTYTPDRKNGTLIERTDNPNIPSITFHRISQPYYLWPRW